MVRIIEVSDGAGNAQDLKIGAGGEIKARNGLLEKLGGVRGERGIGEDFAGVKGTIIASGSAVAFELASKSVRDRGESGGMLGVGVVRRIGIVRLICALR